MEWTKESIITLIKLYHSREILWDPQYFEPKNRHKRFNALSEIASQLSTTPSEIERKIKNLSCHYFREKKKMDDSIKSATNTEDIYESKWFAYKPLDFLSNRKEKKLICRKKKLSEKANDTRHTETSASNDSQAQILSEVTETSSDSQPETSENHFSQPNKRPCRKNRNKNIVSEVVNIMANVSHRKKNDEDALFGDYIAGQLRSMDRSTKAIVRHRINNIIFEAESGLGLTNSEEYSDYVHSSSFVQTHCSPPHNSLSSRSTAPASPSSSLPTHIDVKPEVTLNEPNS